MFSRWRCWKQKQRHNCNFSGLPLPLRQGSFTPSLSSFSNLAILFGFIDGHREHSLKAMATPTFNSLEVFGVYLFVTARCQTIFVCKGAKNRLFQKISFKKTFKRLSQWRPYSVPHSPVNQQQQQQQHDCEQSDFGNRWRCIINSCCSLCHLKAVKYMFQPNSCQYLWWKL